MTFEIEVYKGQSIIYNDDYDKFICEISIEDKCKTTKRMSLNDVRKEIDQFIKLNADFKPFKILHAETYENSFYEKEVTAIRTDGLFVIKYGSRNSFFGEKEMKRAMEYDPELVKQRKALEDEFEKAREVYHVALKELCKKLKPVDLSKYEHIINPK